MLLDNSQAITQADSRLRVLVLCTGNSARSIMAEAILNTNGGNLFQAYSAGSRPTGKVNPMALEQISQLSLPEEMEIRSKNWQEFSQSEAPKLDIVLTVCDNAAAETCPTFAGDYEHIHWGYPDPAGSSDNPDEERQAFLVCFNNIKSRVDSLVVSQSSVGTKSSICKAMRELS
jgi:arsenate reductase